MNTTMRLPRLDDYRKYTGNKIIDGIREKARKLKDYHVSHISSTYYGGGVAELLSPLVILMNDAGIKAGWRVIQGSPDYFSVTKKIHNSLQGGNIRLTRKKKDIYEGVIYENSIRNHLDHDAVVIHDPQPLPMINYYKKDRPWIWRCHINTEKPQEKTWNYLRKYTDKYDAAIFSMNAYKKKMKPEQFVFTPAIDPFCIKNKKMSRKEVDERLNKHKIPTDLPIVAQIARFDKWKDPEGVIKAVKKARKEADCTLVLLGNAATDDPEGGEVYKRLMDLREERIIVISREDTALVNALQTRAAVVLQKSIKEGFGISVTEAMWKGTPVIGGNTGGIRLQIDDRKNGYLVDSADEAAERIVHLIKNPDKRKTMGKRAREKVKKYYLLPGLVDKYLSLFNSIETVFKIKKSVVTGKKGGG